MKAMQFCWLAFISSLAFSLCAAAEENEQVADKNKATTESKSDTRKDNGDVRDRDQKGTVEARDDKDSKDPKVVKVVKYDDSSDNSSEHKHGGNLFTRFWIHTIGGNIGAGLKGKHHDDNSDSNDK